MSTEIHAVYTLCSARQIPLCWPFLFGPKPPQHERQSVCSVVAGDLYGPCRQLQMNHSPKKCKLGRFFFFPQPRNFPQQQQKKKLLKAWVHSCFDFWCIAQLKRDLATRQCSEDEQATWHSASVWVRGRTRENDFVTCYETVSIFNFRYHLLI